MPEERIIPLDRTEAFIRELGLELSKFKFNAASGRFEHAGHSFSIARPDLGGRIYYAPGS